MALFSAQGVNKGCRPKAGWRDKYKCTSNGHCKSKSCVQVAWASDKCKPSGGWNQGEQCTSSSHCGTGGGERDASKCWENGKHDGDCCALRSKGSCTGGASIEWRNSKCWTSGHKEYFRYYCKAKLHLECSGGRCKKRKGGALVKSIASKLTGTGDNGGTRDVIPSVDGFAVRGTIPAGIFQAADVSKTDKEVHTARWVHVLLVVAKCG